MSGSVGPKKIPIHERVILAGDVIAVNGYHANRKLLKQRFAEGGYHVHETEHFLIFTRSEAPTSIIVHWFAPEAINATIGDYLIQELKSPGIVTDAQDFGKMFDVIVRSVFPQDAQRALYLYGTNTLKHYQHLLQHSDSTSSSTLPSASSTMHTFASIYQRVFQLHVGKTFLDVGCSFGFLPLLMSEHFPSLSHVVGVDIQAQPFSTVRAIAEEHHLKNIQFCQADVLTENFSELGHFDTVVALHVLEHLTETEMYCALVTLLNVTSRRLIIAVPYEEGEPEVVYGHEQLFTQEKLEVIGQWCVQHIEGMGRMSYEDCDGGLLVIERHNQVPDNDRLNHF